MKTPSSSEGQWVSAEELEAHGVPARHRGQTDGPRGSMIPSHLLEVEVIPLQWMRASRAAADIVSRPGWRLMDFSVGITARNPRDPSMPIMPTLGPKVCKYHLHWAARMLGKT